MILQKKQKLLDFCKKIADNYLTTADEKSIVLDIYLTKFNNPVIEKIEKVKENRIIGLLVSKKAINDVKTIYYICEHYNVLFVLEYSFKVIIILKYGIEKRDFTLKTFFSSMSSIKEIDKVYHNFKNFIHHDKLSFYETFSPKRAFVIKNYYTNVNDNKVRNRFENLSFRTISNIYISQDFSSEKKYKKSNPNRLLLLNDKNISHTAGIKHCYNSLWIQKTNFRSPILRKLDLVFKSETLNIAGDSLGKCAIILENNKYAFDKTLKLIRLKPNYRYLVFYLWFYLQTKINLDYCKSFKKPTVYNNKRLFIMSVRKFSSYYIPIVSKEDCYNFKKLFLLTLKYKHDKNLLTYIVNAVEKFLTEEKHEASSLIKLAKRFIQRRQTMSEGKKESARINAFKKTTERIEESVKNLIGGFINSSNKTVYNLNIIQSQNELILRNLQNLCDSNKVPWITLEQLHEEITAKNEAIKQQQAVTAAAEIENKINIGTETK